MFSRLRLRSGTMVVVVLVELNIAVSVLVVPDVAPGMTLDTQFDGVPHAPVVADEFQVPLAASDSETAATVVNHITQAKRDEPGTIRRQTETGRSTAERQGMSMMHSFLERRSGLLKTCYPSPAASTRRIRGRQSSK